MTSIITTSITWDVEQMDCYPTYESQTDVVFTVHWRCTAVKDQYTATNYGTVSCTYTAGEPFTPYAQIFELVQKIRDQVQPQINAPAQEGDDK